jgi:hypothetical protein
MGVACAARAIGVSSSYLRNIGGQRHEERGDRMKKPSRKRITLNRETLLQLEDDSLRDAAAGGPPATKSVCTNCPFTACALC